MDVDSKIPNLALMKLSAYHNGQGDDVRMYSPLFDHPDKIYSSKVFTATDKFAYFPTDCEVIQGGSGFDLGIKLSDEIECIYPDYSLYGIDYAMGFTTRGCSRECGFCIVPRKEGKIRPVADIHQFWNGQKRLTLMDNNIAADTEHFKLIASQVIKNKIRTDFNQGIDIRLIDDEKAKLLSKIRLWDGYRYRFAWDSLDLEADVMRGIKTLTKYMKPYKLMFYVLIGFGTTEDEDLYRVETLKSLGIRSFVMPYDRTSEYQRDFARYVNGQIYTTVAWPDYKRGGQ